MGIRLPIIAIGASTGGVEALTRVIAALPANCPPTLIVQHMKGDFLNRLHSRLATGAKARVLAAGDGVELKTGHIYVASDTNQHLTVPEGRTLRCRLVQAAPYCGHRPSVDQLFLSLTWLGGRVSAALLTGMGQDGARGLLALQRAGARTIAQDQETSVVYGMPRVAIELGAACQVLPIERIGRALLDPPAVISGTGT